MNAVQTSMLSVGSGDGSQQESIVKQGLTKVQVTFYDSKAQLLRKYPHALKTLQYLEEACEIPPRYQVDATFVDQLYKPNSFDLIFFTFPHTGIPNSNSRRCVESNQQLLRRFLNSASQIIKPNGEIQITLKNGDHYERWKLPDLLDRDADLALETTLPLDKSMFPGYKHRLTRGATGNLKEVSDKKGAKVYVFCPKTNNTSSGIESRDTPSAMYSGKLLTIVRPPTTAPSNQAPSPEWTDKDLWYEVVVVLESFCAPADVLEIRRQIQDPTTPESRQLNRILYAMEISNIVNRHAPGTKNQKPRWTLA